MTKKKTIAIHWQSTIRINTRDGWREKVGMVLRRMGQDIDGRTTLALELISKPPISDDEKGKIIGCGVDHMLVLLKELTGAEGRDDLLKITHPELFEKDES